MGDITNTGLGALHLNKGGEPLLTSFSGSSVSDLSLGTSFITQSAAAKNLIAALDSNYFTRLFGPSAGQSNKASTAAADKTLFDSIIVYGGIGGDACDHMHAYWSSKKPLLDVLWDLKTQPTYAESHPPWARFNF